MIGVPVARHDHTEHLGQCIEFFQACKGISLLKYLSKYVDRNVLNLYYMLYVRSHLDYGDVIYHNQRADILQLIVSGCWQGTSRERLYDELGWVSPSDRWWACRMTTFYKVKYEFAPSYLPDHLPEQSVNITTPFSRFGMYCNSFFPYCIENWNKLDNSVKIKNILILSFVQKGKVFMV